MRFQDKVVIVTGAGSGIGLATALRFGAEGARVAIAEFDDAKGKAAEAQLRTSGADALALRCDVASEADAIRVVDAAFERWGRLDVIVNNAGVMIFKPIEAHSEADLLGVLRVDLLGAFWFIKQAFLRCPPGTSIVNVSSIHAVETTAAGRGLRGGEGGAALAHALGRDRGPAEGNPRQRDPARRDRDGDAARQPGREIGRRAADRGRRRRAGRRRQGDRLPRFRRRRVHHRCRAASRRRAPGQALRSDRGAAADRSRNRLREGHVAGGEIAARDSFFGSNHPIFEFHTCTLGDYIFCAGIKRPDWILRSGNQETTPP
jgi:hypothetical protein